MIKSLQRLRWKIGYLFRLRDEHRLLERQQKLIAATLSSQVPQTLEPRHLVLIRSLRVTWVPVESGAPGLRPLFPFGIDRPTCSWGMTALGSHDEALLAQTLAEVAQLIPKFVFAGAAALEPGRYALPDEMRDYFSTPESGVDANGIFEFQAEHATILKGMNWRFEQLEKPGWPLPFVDGKRPYGDCTYYQHDMARLLETTSEVSANSQAGLDPARNEELQRLHYQMLAALQVLLTHASIQFGPIEAIGDKPSGLSYRNPLALHQSP